MNSPLVKSASRVLDLIEILALTPRALGVTGLSQRLGIPKSSTSMLLATLEARGYVMVDPARRFRLADELRGADSWIGGRYGMLLRVARPAMAELVEATGESSFLGVMTPDRRLQYVHKAISPNEIRFDADVVESRPLYCTTVGLVLPANQPDADIEAFLAEVPLIAHTPQTVTDPAARRTLLAETRRNGFAVTSDAHVQGASGAALPILGPDGRVLAGLNVSAPTWRFRERREELVAELRRVGRQVNQTMSARTPQ